MKNNRANIVFVLVIFLVVAACSWAKNVKPAGEVAISGFHQQYDDNRFELIYQNASLDFKDATTDEEFNRLLSAVSRKLGKVTSSTNRTWNVKAVNMSTTIVMIQDTEFEKGKGEETFSFEIADGKALLLGYYISSNDLIAN